MGKGGSEPAGVVLEGQEVAGEYRRTNADAFAGGSRGKGTGIQAKLHRWATNDPDRRFGDLFNLVSDPAFLLVAWTRVRTNRGARSAGVDGQTAYYVTAIRGQEAFLADLRADLRARRFVPLPVRERMIPKPGGKLRRLGIPTVAAYCRIVQYLV
jgi:retron-type reverse transcriptase